MIERTPWLSRHFEGEVPNEMFPSMLERLRGTPARIDDRLRGVSPEVLERREGDAWSILENVGHLVQAEELWALRIDDFEAGRAELTPAPFQPGRVRAAGYGHQPAARTCAEFRAARGLLVARLERLDERVLRFVAHHPRLDQPMRVVDLMRFVAEHDDHHLVTITRLLEAAR